jgi:hypothetical protein
MDFSFKLPFLSGGGRNPAAPVLGDSSQLLADQLNGRYYAAAKSGRLFIATSAAAGIALIAPATGGGHPTLINPFGSKRNLSIARLRLSYVSGNNAPTAVEWAYTANVGSGPGPTGSPILTATRVAVLSAMVGGPVDGVSYWSPTVNTFTAAPTFLAPTGLSLFTGVAATAVAPFALNVEYDGGLVVPPGAALSLCTQAATTTALFQVEILIQEIDI